MGGGHAIFGAADRSLLVSRAVTPPARGNDGCTPRRIRRSNLIPGLPGGGFLVAGVKQTVTPAKAGSMGQPLRQKLDPRFRGDDFPSVGSRATQEAIGSDARLGENARTVLETYRDSSRKQQRWPISRLWVS